MACDMFCYHEDDKKTFCHVCYPKGNGVSASTKPRVIVGKTKPTLNPQWLAKMLGASEIVELPASVTNDQTGQKLIDLFMASRGFVRVAVP